jgi:hypothetical protein
MLAIRLSIEDQWRVNEVGQRMFSSQNIEGDLKGLARSRGRIEEEGTIAAPSPVPELSELPFLSSQGRNQIPYVHPADRKRLFSTPPCPRCARTLSSRGHTKQAPGGEQHGNVRGSWGSRTSLARFAITNQSCKVVRPAGTRKSCFRNRLKLVGLGR